MSETRPPMIAGPMARALSAFTPGAGTRGEALGAGDAGAARCVWAPVAAASTAAITRLVGCASTAGAAKAIFRSMIARLSSLRGAHHRQVVDPERAAGAWREV